MRFFTSLLIVIVLVSFIGKAQWVNNPAANLMICDLTGEQALPKIVSTSDGGCYVSWFDLRSGQYCVYLQRLNPLGYKQWDTNGLLISSNPQSTSLVDYSLICDGSDNAILIFCDTRNAGNLNPFAYKISPSGTFLWGNNGVDLYNSADFQANGHIAQTDDSGYVFAWIVASSPTKIGLQKLSSDGTKLWGTTPVLLTGSTGQGYNYPAVVKSDNNSVLLLHTMTTGSFPAQTVKLRAQKLNSSGVKLWGADGISIQNLGKIAAFSVPYVISDGMNGAFMSWHDDRDNNSLQSAFVQRVASDSMLYFPTDGAEASLAAQRQKYNPVVSFDQVSGNTYVFWMETEPDQNQNGIMGQKLSLSGARLWGDNAKVFKDLSAPFTASISNVSTQIGSDRAYVFYLYSNGSGVNTSAEGFACNSDGQFVWPGNFVTLSNPTTEKLHLSVTSDVYHNCKLAWEDRRGDGGIYAQDINPSGQLGSPVTPVELVSFTSSVQNNIVSIQWITATETNNRGFEIERSITATSGWEKIGYLEGKGTTSETSVYTYSDQPGEAGTYYYRLKQIDMNGAFTFTYAVEADLSAALGYSLNQNYPNPFNPGTVIRYSIPSEEKVSIKIFDLLGSEVRTLVNELQGAGNYQIYFDAAGLAGGVYYCTMTAGDFNAVRKLTLLK